MRLVLASASPRRAELLRAAGFEFDVQAADVDERVRLGETPEAYVRRVAADKARVVAARHGGRVVLAADTIVVVDGAILGKPRDAADARRMLRGLSGRWHEVMTAVTVVAGGPAADDVARGGEAGRSDGPAEAGHSDGAARAGHYAGVARTRVEFARLSDLELDWYVASGEPLDKAGAYAIQGLASRFVTRIEGSYSNVVGLPVSLVAELLKRIAPAEPPAPH